MNVFEMHVKQKKKLTAYLSSVQCLTSLKMMRIQRPKVGKQDLRFFSSRLGPDRTFKKNFKLAIEKILRPSVFTTYRCLLWSSKWKKLLRADGKPSEWVLVFQKIRWFEKITKNGFGFKITVGMIFIINFQI